MSKARTKFICQSCGAESPAYYGRCPDCGSWDSMVETVEPRAGRAGRGSSGGSAVTLPGPLSEVPNAGLSRHLVPFDEFNRVLGGGLVPGSLVLVGGDPGIGKSTLLLQIAALLSHQAGNVLYVSAEESAQQVKMRADRLGLDTSRLFVLSETNLATILGVVERMNPGLLVVDSIQTVYLEELTSAAGSVSQVRECTSRIVQLAKPRNLPVFIVGHVTKEGAIAGPRVLEHMVDAVLYLEGDRYHQYRILRAVKNRFGSTDEVGVFEMADAGLREIRNPSEAFLQERAVNSAGSAVAVTLEGTRPILLEVQALATDTSFGLPRRTANGFDLNRLQLLIAVLTKRVGLPLSGQDVYVNIVGGLRVVEPAVDLAVAVAVASSFRERPVDTELALIGEVGLSGEVRTVGQIDRRLREAARLGFTRAIVPGAFLPGRLASELGMQLSRVATVAEAIEVALGLGPVGWVAGEPKDFAG